MAWTGAVAAVEGGLRSRCGVARVGGTVEGGLRS